ncbi:MAG: hypothetical protein KHZ61_04550 [Lachnospiraceae bacterium]|jgi:hypothetical protein|nr:hypothetical protein [Lachnospiraceae bacterium]
MPSNFFKNFVDKASSATQSALEKGKVQVEITKLNLDSNNAEGHIKQAKESIGDYVYANNLLSDNADLAKFFDTIREEQARIDANNEKIAQIKNSNPTVVNSADVPSDTEYTPSEVSPIPTETNDSTEEDKTE